MIEAVILAAIFAGTMLPIAIVAFREATGRREEAVARAKAEANATSYATQLADMTNRHREEKQRADNIEDAVMQSAVGSVAGSHGQLLQAIAAARAARGDGSRAVPADAAAAAPRRGDTDLLPPGGELE
jgi:hypothetical protein